jgi:hypothetical protein
MAENKDRRLDQLFAAARTTPPDTSRAEEGFEGRVLARIRGRRRGKEAISFGAWSWRLSPLFAAAVLAVTVWTAATIPDPVAGAGSDIAAAWEASDMADFLGGDG